MPHGRALSFAAKRQECCVSNITPPQAEKFFCPTFCTLQKVGKRSAARRQKVLILLVRGRCLGVLIRGLQSLGSSRKGDGFILFASCKKNQKARQRLASLWTPGTIQSSAGNTVGEDSDGTSRTHFFAQNGGEKALNRCEVRVLQREDLERRLKE